jgi:NitT/TauT family transport system ATP-binding protein
MAARKAAQTAKPGNEMPHIEIRDVSLVYDTPAGQVTGVEKASFAIEQSEFLCIVGPSGCGKSTLLNIIAGFLEPTGGEIRIAGKAVKGHGQDRGVVFQDFAQLFPWRTALGNVAFGLEMKGVGKAERENIARKQLALVKLEKFANSYPHHLSGGMQQRVAIARALAIEPDILLMDEPFSHLDAITARKLRFDLMDILAKAKPTILFGTHDLSEAVFLSDRIYMMSTRPARIFREVQIEFPRPRRPENEAILDLEKTLVRDFFSVVEAKP